MVCIWTNENAGHRNVESATAGGWRKKKKKGLMGQGVNGVTGFFCVRDVAGLGWTE